MRESWSKRVNREADWHSGRGEVASHRGQSNSLTRWDGGDHRNQRNSRRFARRSAEGLTRSPERCPPPRENPNVTHNSQRAKRSPSRNYSGERIADRRWRGHAKRSNSPRSNRDNIRHKRSSPRYEGDSDRRGFCHRRERPNSPSNGRWRRRKASRSNESSSWDHSRSDSSIALKYRKGRSRSRDYRSDSYEKDRNRSERRSDRRFRNRSRSQTRSFDGDDRRVVRRKDPPLKLLRIVAIRDIGSSTTEAEIEDRIRSAAIAFGFSPPNLVKVHRPVNRPTETASNKESFNAYAEFPSAEAAAAFVKSCGREFTINSRRLTLELAAGYIAPQGIGVCPGWQCILCDHQNKEGAQTCLQCHGPHLEECPLIASTGTSLGPNLTNVDLTEFSLDRQSGLQYHAKRGLYYDPQTQQCISSDGFCYDRHPAKPGTYVPVGRVAASKDLNGFMKSLKNHIDSNKTRKNIKDGEAEDDATFELVPKEDPEQVKASAVAAILAAAQSTAQAMQRFEKSGGKNSVPNESVHKKAAVDLGTLFGESALRAAEEEDEESLAQTAGQQTAPVAKIAKIRAKQIREAVPGPTAVSQVSSGPVICFVCLREFSSKSALMRHEVDSVLHRKNLLLQTGMAGGPDTSRPLSSITGDFSGPTSALSVL